MLPNPFSNHQKNINQRKRKTNLIKLCIFSKKCGRPFLLSLERTLTCLPLINFLKPNIVSKLKNTWFFCYCPTKSRNVPWKVCVSHFRISQTPNIYKCENFGIQTFVSRRQVTTMYAMECMLWQRRIWVALPHTKLLNR